MCGVIGLVYEQHRGDLGVVAADLLKTLEYRGYDSTGGAFQGDGTDVTLLKGVGAPSNMVEALGITSMSGRAFCGQVRWATFGAVTEANSQPHVVRCLPGGFLYGAHNGNVTNCDDLHAWLTGEGHRVASDNDGEMVVHTVEHYFVREIAKVPAGDVAGRRSAMRRALLSAAARLHGSFAAVIVDPETRVMWAVKKGSSLHFGVGQDPVHGRFAIASSDLSSVLKLTRVLVPLAEGEFVEYDPTGFAVYAVAKLTRETAHGRATIEAGQLLERVPERSRLRAADTALVPPFQTYMDQEISAQAQTLQSAIQLFEGGSDASRAVVAPDADLVPEIDALLGEFDDAAIARRFHALVERPAVRAWLSSSKGVRAGAPLHSADAGFLHDLLPMARNEDEAHAIAVIDAWLEAEEVRDYRKALDQFAELCAQAVATGGRIFAVSCGSSFHAAKAGSLFFNEIAHAALTPLLPGEFRGQVSRTIKDGDVIIAVSQSGETKDLIDVLDDVMESGKSVGRVAVVNNVNSTIAQEKASVVIPLRCGPEIAVPATKSFMSQLAAFYVLALHVAERLERDGPSPGRAEELPAWRSKLRAAPQLIRDTVKTTDTALDKAAEFLYMRPSMHLLATRIAAIAREGALKIREVVLNHTEGYEASEFKHGPNTILGFNTIYGPEEVLRMMREVGSRGKPTEALGKLKTDYPLIYLTGPNKRDVALTVSQINTHKIRGASSVVIAEDDPGLRNAALRAPADNPRYQSAYIALPKTGSTLLTVFSSTVALQRLALKMSLLKKQYLDRLGILDHGVDPDAPKNASKSITVD